MKKTMLLSIGLVLVVSLVVYAGNQETPITELNQTDECQTADGGIHAAAHGRVIKVSQNKATSVTIVIKDAAPDHTYAVYSGGKLNPDLIGTFTTNKNGNGVLHVNMAGQFICPYCTPPCVPPCPNAGTGTPDFETNIWNNYKESPDAELLLTGGCICDCPPPCVPTCPCAEPLV